ncbi:MAG: TolC family protein [Verrucomicrobiales bacterium]|nr:TolC family protein [Verrucomicrobiales bacterium]
MTQYTASQALRSLRSFASVGSLTLLLGLPFPSPAATNAPPPAWPDRPLSVADCLNLAEAQNGTIAAAKKDLEASEGVVIQTRAILLPKLQASGNFTAIDESSIEAATTPFGTIDFGQTESWETGIRLVQSIYEGGRMRSATRTARLTRESAMQQYQTTLLDALLSVRLAYYDALLALEQITVQEASVNLLERELQDNQRRFDAGSVPRFNVLRAEVELANARPRLIRARNAWRNGKTYLASLLGYRVPDQITEDIPLQLSDRLEVTPFELNLGTALAMAQENRTELKALRAAEALRREGVVDARAGQLPSLQAFAGYGVRRSQFGENLTSELHGWNAGVQASWNIFDGRLTRGRIVEATARQEQATLDYDNAARQISVEVRTAYSNFIEAREVLESQKKVVEQATEALRLATARSEAGSGTQLDVLGAQTALTEARTTQNLASRDYLVALARLQRATGLGVQEAKPK